MASTRIVKFGELGNAASSIPGWTVVSGSPKMESYFQYESEDGNVISGTWISTPGTYYASYSHPTMHEFVHIIEGRMLITPDGSAPIPLESGDAFVVEPGFKGTWEVIVMVRKHFVLASGK